MIQPGVTTADEVVKAFGQPAQRVAGKGRTLMFWSVVYWASPTSYPGSISLGPSEDSHARALSVLFDQDNRVVAKHYSAHSFRTTFGAASVSAGTRPEAQVLSQIKPYITKKAEAVALLGEPMMESLTLDGSLMLEWDYVQGDAIVGRTQLRKLEIVIGPSDTVVALRQVDER